MTTTQDLARSEFYRLVANRLLFLVETNPHLSKSAMLDSTSTVLQLSFDALEVAYDLQNESD